MTNPKPNTPADELEKRIYSILQHQFLGPLEPTDVDVDEAYGDIMVLFYSELEQAVREAYKRGYAKGGVDEILRHQNAIQAVAAELQSTIKEDKSNG